MDPKVATMEDATTYGTAIMKAMKARGLKDKTGEALRLVKQGEKVMITVYGNPRAILSPVEGLTLPEGKRTSRGKNVRRSIEGH
jgi:antitoxin (DNA-binding transcriptional repressor) of toxin-antitoxin stability system